MNRVTKSVMLAVVVLVVSAAIAQGASTSTAVRPGDSLSITCAGSKLLWVRSTTKTGVLTCAGRVVATTTTTAVPTTTTTLPRSTTTTRVPSTTTIPPATTTTTIVTTTTTTTTPPPGGSTLALPRIPWDGGSAYWRKFAKADAAGWDDPSFFPIAVFFGKPQYAQSLYDIGVNTYMGAEHDGSPVSTITGTGMSLIAQDEWTRAEVGNDARVVGWHACDEPDMGGCGGANEAESLSALQNIANGLRSYNDGRFVFANFGNGVLRSYWMPSLFGDMVRSIDASSVDKYAYTSPHVQGLLPGAERWPAAANPKSSGAYGWLADQMRSFLTPATLRPEWVFVEAARPYLIEDGSEVISGARLEGAVWNAIIHDARGIAYFEHSNDPSCDTQHSLVVCPNLNRETVRKVNAKVKSLAPVINTQSYVYDFANGTDTMLKTYGNSAYVFAGIGLNKAPGTKTFTLPAGVTGTTVTVVGENRTIPVVGRSFSDNFAAEYSHHVYQIGL